jgi:S1-C subfamily serine protease
LVIAGLGLGVAPTPAAEKGTLSGKEIFQRTLKSVVWIVHKVETDDGQVGIASGSGSVIDVPKRLVLTNWHVVRGKEAVTVFFPQFDRGNKLVAAKERYLQQFLAGGGLPGRVLYSDSKRDLALVELAKLPSGTTAVPLAKEGVGPGDTVHSLGNPGASDALWAYTPGAVKTVYKKSWEVADRTERRVTHHEAQVVETTSPVNPGDSGGPLLNSQGELVAVTQGGVLRSQGTISYFIDVSEVRAALAAKKIRLTTGPQTALATAAEVKAEEPAKPLAKDPAAEAADQSAKDEKAARAKLDFAEQFLRDRPEKAKERLEEIIRNYPNTRAAREAKELLAKLRK